MNLCLFRVPYIVDECYLGPEKVLITGLTVDIYFRCFGAEHIATIGQSLRECRIAKEYCRGEDEKTLNETENAFHAWIPAIMAHTRVAAEGKRKS
jgi:hypothetical protein